MAAYLIVEAVITDREQFGAYAGRVRDAVPQFGGEYVVLGGEAESLEGDWGEARIVIHRWPDRAAAKRFWDSEEYNKIKCLRKDAGRFRVMLVDSYEPGAMD